MKLNEILENLDDPKLKIHLPERILDASAGKMVYETGSGRLLTMMDFMTLHGYESEHDVLEVFEAMQYEHEKESKVIDKW
jgi:hypothetical protein